MTSVPSSPLLLFFRPPSSSLSFLFHSLPLLCCCSKSIHSCCTKIALILTFYKLNMNLNTSNLFIWSFFSLFSFPSTVCKVKAHKRCAVRAMNNCKWTTLSSIGKDIIEEEDGVVSSLILTFFLSQCSSYHSCY